MKTEYKTTNCTVAIHATYEKGYNKMSIHRYDENDEPLKVVQIKYASNNMPATECFSAIENAAEAYGYEIDIREQDSGYYHGYITQ